MKIITIILAIITFVISNIILSSVARAGVVDDAYNVCAIVKASKLVTKCDVNGWDSTISFRIDTTSREARKMCSGLVRMISKKTDSFAKSYANKWKLKIFSPYSGEHHIADCILN